MSFVPYLQKSPDSTETASTPPLRDSSKASIGSAEGGENPPSGSSVIDPHGTRRWQLSRVQLSGSQRTLNEYSVERVGEKVDNNLVLLHGYGAGLGFFYRNFEGLSRLPGWRIYALDLLGMGRSSRPQFRIRAKDRQNQVSEAEDWFIDALEEWRINRKIERFTLLGHSLGGYMAVAYALKYPGRLNKLILASPVGIPEDPYAVDSEMPGPEYSTVLNEFTEDQMSTTGDISIRHFAGNQIPISEANAFPRAQPRPRRMPRWMVYLWEANISPFSIVRWSGPLGPCLVSGWTSRRFTHLPLPEAEALHQYSYSLFRQRGSGEYVLAYVLAPGAFARSPLIRRIKGVGRQVVPNASTSTKSDTTTAYTGGERENGIPVVLMYGENDWMDAAWGYAAAEKIKLEKERLLRGASAEKKAKDNGEAKVVVIKKAGHHLYLDRHQQFVSNKLVALDFVRRLRLICLIRTTSSAKRCLQSGEHSQMIDHKLVKRQTSRKL